jgi:exoribonuclease R
MLIIRTEQIQHFIAKNDSELVKLIAEIMRSANNERIADYTNETLEAMISLGIERARTHKFDRAQDIAAFVAVMFEISPTFDENEEIKAVLDETDFPIEDRFEQLWERVPDETWKKIENEYDAKIWFPEQPR